MPDTASLTIIKRFTFRGKDEEWSNTYHFLGTTPGTDAAWKTLADAVILSEATCWPSNHQAVRAYGYEAGNEHAVAAIYYDQAPLTPVQGVLSVSTSDGTLQAGDAAGWVRANTGIRGANGKYRYVRKYFHGVYANALGVIPPAVKTAYVAHANKMIGGTLPGSFKWCTPQGLLAVTPQASAYTTTRTLKRRGRRPSS